MTTLTPNRKQVVILHGLFGSAVVTMPLKAMLSYRGYQCLSLSYPTRKQTLAASAEELLPQIQDFAQGEALCYVGHSLGGLLIRHLRTMWGQGFESASVVTLGTPHLGSKVADYFSARQLSNAVLGDAWHHALDGLAPDWHHAIPLLSIAGTKPFGIGKTLGVFADDEAHDGTVAVAETRLPQAQAYAEIDATHTSLLFSPSAVSAIDKWFQATCIGREVKC